MHSRPSSAVTMQIAVHLRKQIPFHFLLPCLELLCNTSPTLFKSAFVGLICTILYIVPPTTTLLLCTFYNSNTTPARGSEWRLPGVRCDPISSPLPSTLPATLPSTLPAAMLRSSDTLPRCQIDNSQLSLMFASKMLPKSDPISSSA